MIRRLFAFAFLAWLLGLIWFAVFLPRPAPSGVRTDAVVVLTGAPGRFQRGLDVLKAHRAERLLVSGVDPSVRRAELDQVMGVPRPLSRCCIDLDKASVDTISNARETARWITAHHYSSVRLVTSDWHMRRARLELEHSLPGKVRIVSDAVPSEVSLTQLFKEYNKLLARVIALELGPLL
ncbi:MAG: YdcF family protein [Chakrabartia sp.]